MRKKFTYLISLAVAMICSSGGVAWGQTYTYWQALGTGTGAGSGYCHDLTYPGEYDNRSYGVPSCGKIEIDGEAYMNYYRWSATIPNTATSPKTGSFNATDAGLVSQKWCNGSYHDVDRQWKSYIRYDSIANTWTRYYQYRDERCTSSDTWSEWGGWSTWSPSSLGWDVATRSTAWHEWGKQWDSGTNSWTFPYYWGHTPHDHNSAAYNTLTVNLPAVISAVDFITPTWKHNFYLYTLSWDSQGNPTYTPTLQDQSQVSPLQLTGALDYGVMDATGNSGIRFTGNADQIAKTGSVNSTLKLPTKVWFDQEWDGEHNGVDVISWDPETGVTGGQTVGFWHGYSGDMDITNGTLLLGEDNTCPSQSFKINTTGNVLIDAYNQGAPTATGCNSLPYVVTYNPASVQPKIDASQLQITNSNGDCYPVNFCSIFQPEFSGNGPLLINPNVTNFQADATLDNSAHNTNSNINIYSKKITTTGNFIYTSGTGTSPLHVKISVPQNPACADCGFFYVTGDFTSTNTANGNGSVLINDEGTRGYVKVDGTYNHTGETATGRTHTVNVTDYISVGGVTTLTGNKDVILFNSADSWIKFGAAFNYVDGDDSLKVYANGTPCVDNTCSTGGGGGYALFNGLVTTTNTNAGTTTIKSTKDSVSMQNGYKHTGADGDMLVDGETSVNIAKTVEIQRNGTGDDSIISGSGHIDLGETLTYTQTVSDMTGLGSGLLIQASGTDCQQYCNNDYVEGYVHITGLASTTNTGFGFTRIISNNDYVQFDAGMEHTGKANELIISGDKRVDIFSATGAKITMDSIGLHNGSTTGNATIESDKGHVYVQGPVTYKGAPDDFSGSNAVAPANLGYFKVFANGACDAMECSAGTNYRTGGFVWFNNTLDITQYQDAQTSIVSTQHYVQVDGDYTYTGEATIDNTSTPTMLVSGHTGVDFNSKVNINMDSTGLAKIESPKGHIHIADMLTYTQDTKGLNGAASGAASYGENGENGLDIIASGQACGDLDRNNRPGLGYVWFEKDVNTTNKEHGSTNIEAEHHYVLMDQKFTHHGVEGNLNIIAGTSTSDPSCDVNCENAETILPQYDGGTYLAPKLLTDLHTYTPGTPTTQWFDAGALTHVTTHGLSMPYTGQTYFSHAGRGYVRVAGDANITMDSIGKATIQSKSDVVQYDNKFNYHGLEGGDLLVDGYLGIRTLGDATTENLGYLDNSQSDWSDKFGGNTAYNSAMGFIDFYGSKYTHDAHQQNPVTTTATDASRNTYSFSADPLTYTLGDGAGSSLDMDAYKRIRFSKNTPVTITMDSTYGHAKFYAHKGFVDYGNTFTFDGTATATHNGTLTHAGSVSTPGDLLILAYGEKSQGRSCFDTLPVCTAPYAGVVLFQDVVNIALADTGRTIIKSKNDDVMMFDNFFYVDNTTAGEKKENGQFWMQAGQDILGAEYDVANHIVPSFGKVIGFTQAGQKSIVMEAQGTIHTTQYLNFDRKDAKAGSILLRAGYDYVAEPFTTNAQDPKLLAWSKNAKNASCPAQNYTERSGMPYCTQTDGGDIWFEGSVNVDLSQVSDAVYNAAATETKDSVIHTVLRALQTVYIDSSFTYVQNQQNADNFKTGDFGMYAQTGNIEAIKDSTTSVFLNIMQPFNTTEIRLMAGNNPFGDNCDPGICNSQTAFDGNILFNKPLDIYSLGKGYTILTAERDIENQVDAPFTFTYTNQTDSLKDFLMTAGRHIEAHRTMTFNYDTANYDIKANITMEAGRMEENVGCSNKLCKVIESGSSLTGTNGFSYEPGDYPWTNEFSKGGAGQGSIFLFDTLLFTYNGKGDIEMRALNGNIESDPYLHREDDPVHHAPHGNMTDGYNSLALTHNSPIIFNHDSAQGKVLMRAIDIKLHDKLDYLASSNPNAANNYNGQFYMSAFDSILSRNIKYENQYDSGSVFITTAKYKDVSPYSDASPSFDCGEYDCTMGGPGIHQGHIVLGYGADTAADDAINKSDSIIFDFNSLALNANTFGANLLIKAGYTGYSLNMVTGKRNTNLFNASGSYTAHYAGMDRGKAYGGNITFDFMKINMAKGNGALGGYTEISTPNGNIWGKDSLQYHGINGDLLVDAGDGSLEDTLHAVRWSGFPDCKGGSSEKTLNTQVPTTCDVPGLWRTGNIIMKGGSLNFNDVSVNGLSAVGTAGTGNAIFRTREGFIDTYDAFTVDSMQGDLLKYAGTLDAAKEIDNEWGDISERDFEYHPIAPKSGSVFYGADDNIMMNYGYSNYDQGTPSDGYLYGGVGLYDVATRGAGTALAEDINPYYFTSYMPIGADAVKSGIAYRSVYNVNEDGYMWYRHGVYGKNIWKNGLHLLYRTCHDTPSGNASCSPAAGECKTVDNHARDLYFNFDVDAANTDIMTGGLGIVAMNYIDMFTKFTYFGGQGSGMGAVPGMTTLHGEGVQGYGLYMKSLSLANGTVNSNVVEQRRETCLNCGGSEAYPIGGSGPIQSGPLATHEWTYIGFHDDARIYTEDQKGLIEAPVVEFFGHAELNPYKAPTNSANTLGSGNLTVKGDSLIFHDSAIFDGEHLLLLPYTTDAAHRNGDMRYGVINDLGTNTKYYRVYGKAITMEDRNTPIIEFGYQRCYEPKKAAWNAPNQRSMEDKENTPYVGGDIIVTCRDGYEFPIFNTIVANHARISFISDSIDSDGTITRNVVDAYIRTDLLRIRNNVEFYTDPTNSKFRRGTLKMTSLESMPSVHEPGIFPHHLHMEPGSELSIPGEDSLFVEMTTTVGGYGNIHEDIKVMPGGTIAPGLSSLMEGDCQTSYFQGKLTIHNLKIEPNGIFRISIGDDNMTCWNEYSQEYNGQCTQTDTLVVEDTIDMREKVYLKVLPKTEHVDEGCYLFLVYGDSTGISKEYVKNLVLDPNSLKYDDKYFGLDFSEPGKVYLCVTAFPMPDIQRYVSLPAVTGVTTTPSSGKNYVKGNQNFSFTASYAGAPLKVTAEGYYSHELRDLDYTAVVQPDGSYLYTIYQVVEPWTVQIGPEASTVGNEAIDGQRVWAYKNTLHINVDKSDIVSIYNLTGVLYKRVEVPEGNSKFTLDRGMYVVTLKDGSVYKIVIK